MVHKYKDGWIKAKEEEYKDYDNNGTWTDAVSVGCGRTKTRM
jgi:hypothetical protein